MIAWSTVLFGVIQLIILAVHYHLAFGHERRLSSLEDTVQSVQGKVSNSRADAKRVARKEAEEALNDPANRKEPEESGGMDMNPMMMMMLQQMMGQGGQAPEGEQNERHGPTIGHGGNPPDTINQ